MTLWKDRILRLEDPDPGAKKSFTYRENASLQNFFRRLRGGKTDKAALMREDPLQPIIRASHSLISLKLNALLYALSS
jgi:hypothetical protein